ncbi:MAG TPA: hypothetical protein VM925_07440 [Labilithrix sp.]|nr:hypothetical protein [Labilithrix sp.]
MDRGELERLDRESLVMRAQAAGIRRARVLTRPELVDELLRLDPAIDTSQLKKSRGFFGLARDLLTKVVERGLHLPDAADRLRAALGEQLPQVPRPEPQAVPTVTLAEIYAAQGHRQRALETLLRVLEAEPEHGAARTLLERLEALDYVPPSPPLPPEPDEPRDEIGANLGTPLADEALGASADAESDVERTGLDVDTAEAPAAEPAEVEVATPRVGEPATRPLAAGETECVAIPLEDGRSYVWWQLSDHLRRSIEGSTFVVRALVLVPTWDGPQRETRDVACDPAATELVLDDLPEHAIVRVAVGVMDGPTFVPLAHSPALEISASRELVQWTPDGAFPVGIGDPRASSIARAAVAAGRAGRSIG